jgi:hypothetical protein
MSSNSNANAEPQQHFPMFWRNAESLMRVQLLRLGVEAEDADLIASEITRRCADIKPVLPTDPRSQVHRDFGALMCDAVTAEQRLLAARTGRKPGFIIGDWPPTPLKFTHPFLVAVQCVVSELEAEVHRAERGRRLN